MKFSDKVVVVTGGANGIGLSIVDAFLEAGASVCVIDLQKEPVACGLYFCGDIADENTLVSFVDAVVTRFGGVDFLVNNACLSGGGIISGCGYEDFLYLQKVGVVAPYMLSKLFLPYFRTDAAIVNISSTRASMSQPDTESYTAAKGGINALTHALAISLAGKLRVNSISPGWINTANSAITATDHSQHPAGRVGTPADVAKLTLFLCSKDSSFITGENITVDGGMTKLMIYHNDNGWELKVEN